MANSENNAYRQALVGEIDSAIAQLQTTKGQGECKAHNSVVFGQIVLLRCEKARLEQPTAAGYASTDRRISRKEFVGWCAGISTIIVGFFEGLRRLFGG